MMNVWPVGSTWKGRLCTVIVYFCIIEQLYRGHLAYCFSQPRELIELVSTFPQQANHFLGYLEKYYINTVLTKSGLF